MTTALLNPIALRGAAARDGGLDVYAKAVHGHDIEPYQEAWEEALRTRDRVLIVCPPDTHKSTTVQYFVERTIGKNPNSRTLWLMNTGTQAEARVMSVGQIITSNPFYRQAFPHVKPDPEAKWTKSMLYVERDIVSPDPTLMAAGWDGPYQGMHFDTIILDDLTDQKDVYSPATMQMQELKLRGVILDRLVEAGRIVAIMTRWGENDLLPVFESMGFTIIEMPVVADYPWGPTLSPTKFPLEAIPRMRRDKTDAIFDLTYMCNPKALSGSIIKSIKYWNKDNLPKNAALTLMVVDPAASLKNWADPSGIGIGLLEPKTHSIYVTDVIRKRMDVNDLEATILHYAKKTAGLIAIGLETIGFQLTLLQRLRKVYNLPVRELPYRTLRQSRQRSIGLDRDKHSRAIYVEHKFANSQLYLPDPQMKMLDTFEGVSVESELTSFPFGKHDESVDLLAFLCSLADAYSSPRVTVRLRGW